MQLVWNFLRRRKPNKSRLVFVPLNQKLVSGFSDSSEYFCKNDMAIPT